MSEMIERVAKAIWGDLGDWENTDGDMKESVRREARRAIAAMREPTEAMMLSPCVWGEDDKEAYQAIIDAALSDV